MRHLECASLRPFCWPQSDSIEVTDKRTVNDSITCCGEEGRGCQGAGAAHRRQKEMVLVQPFLGCIATGTTSSWQQSHLKLARQPSWSRAEVFVAKGNQTPAESSLRRADNSPDSHDRVKATHHLQWVSGDPDVSQITFFYKTWHSSKFVIEDVCLLKRNVHFMEPNTLDCTGKHVLQFTC